MPEHQPSRSELRTLLRARRNALSAAQQEQAAQALAKVIARQRHLRIGKRVAFYIPSDGEISPWRLMENALEQGRECYLPVMEEAAATLQFRSYRRGDLLIINHYGVSEPGAEAQAIDAKELDTVFMPLVAFDVFGGRLGRGKGCYDRTFAFLREGRGKAPKLVGLAHECQKLDRVEAAAWDLALEAVATDQDLYWRSQPEN